MNFFPTILRAHNFPPINFRKIAANRDKKLYLLYLFLNAVKSVFKRFTKNLRKIETGTIQDAPYRECDERSREGQNEKNSMYKA